MVAETMEHKTVLLQEAVEGLVTDPNGVYVDGTFGRGGHSGRVLPLLSAQGRLIGFDKDPQAIATANKLAQTWVNFQIVYASFAHIKEQLAAIGIDSVDGILLDLGVSSPQLDDPQRGFSFQHDGPLDMRMDFNSGESAAQWLQRASVDEISSVLKDFGEERFARRIANAIVSQREQRAITTTGQLAALIADNVPTREKGKHPATRSFQAIRIFVNQELDDLTAVLEQSVQLLNQRGRLVVISFHSLEDRIVKRFIQRKEKGAPLPRHLPIQEQDIQREMRALGKPVRASEAEVNANPRARSAIMRIAEKL